MKYLIVIAELDSTGIWEKYGEDYLEPSELGLSNELSKRINAWLIRYWDQHYTGYDIKYKSVIDELDLEGRRIARAIKQELQDVKIEYFSDAYGTLEMIL